MAVNSAVITPVQKLVPRKKFDQKSMIKLVLERSRTHDIAGWAMISRPALVKKFAYDLANSKLWVYGSPDFAFPENVTMPEVLFLFSDMTPETYVKEKGEKRLRFKPVFSPKYKQCNASNGCYTPQGPLTVFELNSRYFIEEKRHKQCEPHHPDGQAWICDDAYNKPWISFEVVFDVFASLLRSGSVRTMWPKLLHILNGDKFKHLNVKYVYAALVHIMVRGVADTTYIKMSSQWRQMSAETAESHYNNFLNGIPSTSMIASYKLETIIHQLAVTHELNLIRAPIKGMKHDWSKFTPKSIYYYTWYWGVWNNLTDVQKHRALAGCKLLTPTILTDENCRFTMWSPSRSAESLGSSFAKGASEILDDRLEAHERSFSESIRETVSEAINESASTWSEHVSGLMNDFFSKASDLSTNFWDTFATRAEAVIGGVKQNLSSLSSSMMNIEIFAQQIAQCVNDRLSQLVPCEGLSLSVSSLLSAIKYYIIFLNVENKFMKGLCFLMMLESIGCVSTIMTQFMRFVSMMQSPADLGEVEGNSAQPTSFKDSFYSILTEPLKLIKVAILCFVQCGLGIKDVLSKIDILSILKSVSTYARELHFIGGGILGIQRAIDAFKKIYEFVVGWIKLRIYKIEDPKRKISREILKWILEVRYFSTERGITAIRTSKSALERASKLFARGQTLLAQVSPASDLYDYKLYSDVSRYFRESKIIANFITRRRAVTGFQPTMFHVQFVGKAGIGKSTLTKRFVRDLISNLWKDTQADDCWAYNPNLEFFDGYTGQKIMIIDDMFRMNEPKHLTTLIGLVTNTPIVLPMANLEDKGIQLTSEILLSSTNTPYPRGKDVLCMEAVHRRRHMLVHTECDPRVLSKSTGQFELALFNEYYPDQNLEDMPHLTFSLLQPVPQEADLEQVQELDRAGFAALYAYADKLRDANEKILVGKHKLDPMFYFSEKNAPPSPLKLPCKNWTYQQLVANSVVRFTAFRGMEGRLSKVEKYGHVESTLAEIDMLLDQCLDLTDLKDCEIPDVVQRTKLLDGFLTAKFEEVESPYAVFNEVEHIIGDDDLCPEIADLDFDTLINEFLTSDTSSDSFEVLDEPQAGPSWRETVSLRDEQARRNAILKRKNKNLPDYAEQNRLDIVKENGKIYLGTNSTPTVWDELMQTMFDPTYAGSYTEVVHIANVVARIRSQQCGITNWPRLENSPALNDFINITASSYLHIPNTSKFPASMRGKRSQMPIELLKRLAIVNGRPMLDVTELNALFPNSLRVRTSTRKVCYDLLHLANDTCECDGEEIVEMTNEIILGHNGNKYKVIPDIGLIFGSMGSYAQFCKNLDQFSNSQIEELIQIAKYRYSLTGIYTPSGIKASLRECFDGIEGYVKGMFEPVSELITRNFKPFMKVALSALALGVVIYSLKELARLFYPTTVPTSKYLHRGPLSSVVHSGRFTTLFNNSKFDNMFGSIVMRNLFEIELSDGLRSACCHAMLSSQYVLLNKHSIRHLDKNNLLLTIKYPEIEPLTVKIDASNVGMDPNGDIAILYSQNIPAARTIEKFLISDGQYKNLEVQSDVCVISRDGNNFGFSQNSPYKKVQQIKFSSKSGDMIMDDGLLIHGATIVGRSGSPVFLPKDGTNGMPILLGVQAWEIDSGFDSIMAVQILTKEKFSFLKTLVTKPVIMRYETYDPIEVSDLNSAFTSQDFNNVCCKNENFKVGWVGETQFRKSPIATLMDLEDAGSKSVPASLNPSDRLLSFGREIHPLKHSMDKYSRGNIKPYNEKMLNYIIKSLISYFSHRLDKKKFSKLNIEQIICGTHEDGSNPMNLKSSPGIPYIFRKEKGKKGKKSFFEIDEEGCVSHLSDEVINDYQAFKDIIRQGEHPLTISYDFPKDELRPFKKARGDVENNLPPKTRTVTCMNMLYIMLWRELTLDLWASFHRLADGSSPLCPGINPEGPEWNTAYHWLLEHPNAIDFDVSNWDGFLSPQLLFAAGEVICGLLSYQKGSFEYASIMCILQEVLFGYVQYDDVIYQKRRGMTSGFPGTAEMNSLCHFILITYIYLQNTNLEFKYNNFNAFTNNVRCLVYGDDIIITFSNQISSLFNGLTIKDEYLKIGYPVTPANKQSEFVASKKLLDCTFLKSTWRELFPGYMIRKMDMSVAINLVYWTRAKEHPLDQFYSNLHDSLHIVFGYGEKAFNDWRFFLNNMLSKRRLPLLEFSYSDLYDDYILRYFSS